MKRQIRIAPSILAADFGNMREEVRAVISAGAEILHVDVMDGHFVPNLTLGPAMIQALRESVQIPFDVHLMVEEPDHLIPAFLKAMGEVEGSFLTVHQEDNLIAALGVVGMQVALLQKVVFQLVQGGVEVGTVGIVEVAANGLAQFNVGRVVGCDALCPYVENVCQNKQQYDDVSIAWHGV